LPPAYRLCSAGTLCEIPLQLAITDETTQSGDRHRRECDRVREPGPQHAHRPKGWAK
jgi:hypothetical protein